jgi:hypothetical protein
MFLSMACSHPSIEREILFGTPSGYWRCRVCGKVASKESLEGDCTTATTQRGGKALLVYLRESNACAELHYLEITPANDGSCKGRFIDPVPEFLNPFQEGTAYAFIAGKKYWVAKLSADGRFELVRDSTVMP